MHLLCWANHGTVRGGSAFCWKYEQLSQVSLCSFKRTVAPSPPVSWHHSDEFCIAVWVMFTDQSRSVKSRIIALHNSPGIPWHIVLVCSAQAGSLTETEFSKNKWSQCSVLPFFFDTFFHVTEEKKCCQNCKKKKLKKIPHNFLLWMLQEEMKTCRKSHWETISLVLCSMFSTTNLHTLTCLGLHLWNKTGEPGDAYCIFSSICNCLKMAAKSKTNTCVRSQCAQLIIPGPSSVCRYAQCLYKMTCREELSVCGVKWGSAGNKQITVPPRWYCQCFAQEGVGFWGGGASLPFNTAHIKCVRALTHTNLKSSRVSPCRHVTLPNCFMFFRATK